MNDSSILDKSAISFLKSNRTHNDKRNDFLVSRMNSKSKSGIAGDLENS
jgi:hypothetical protein